MKGVKFEPLALGHIPAILELEKVCQSSPWHENSFRNEINQDQSLFLVASRGGQTVGYGGVWIIADEAHVTTLAVDPAERRHGLGRAIMTELLDRAVERGATCSTLEVRASNLPAIKLYEGMGYVGVGVRKRYYPDNREDALIMWLYSLEGFGDPQ